MRKYCPGCNEVMEWADGDDECDVCGEELLTDDDGQIGVGLLLEVSEKLEKAERQVTVLREVVAEAYNVDCEHDDDGGVLEGEAAQILRGHLEPEIEEDVEEVVEEEDPASCHYDPVHPSDSTHI